MFDLLMINTNLSNNVCNTLDL